MYQMNQLVLVCVTVMSCLILTHVRCLASRLGTVDPAHTLCFQFELLANLDLVLVYSHGYMLQESPPLLTLVVQV